MKSDRLGIVKKLRAAIRDSRYAAVAAFGPESFQYLSGAALPFLAARPDRPVAVVWPRRGEPEAVCPAEWASAVRALGWIRKVYTYEEAGPLNALRVGEAVARALRGRGLGSFASRGLAVGLEMDRLPVPILAALESLLPGAAIADCGPWLAGLRAVKTPAELELLAEAAYRLDHAIVGASHHVLVPAQRPEKGLAEILRVHCLERGLAGPGYHAVALGASGEQACSFWPEAPQFAVGGGKPLRPGELVRMEVRANLGGYWADGARMLVMGPPTPQQVEAYEGLAALRTEALALIRPGARCGQIHGRLCDLARERGIALHPELGVGHGVGVSAWEPPFLVQGDPAELAEGMALVIDPVVSGPGGELMRSRDTVFVTAGGCRIVGWYKDWREPYVALVSYPHGGG